MTIGLAKIYPASENLNWFEPTENVQYENTKKTKLAQAKKNIQNTFKRKLRLNKLN